MMSKTASREHVVSRIKEIRTAAEAEVEQLLDTHMETYHATATDFWAHAERCAIEVDSWPTWKRRACYSQS